MANIEVDWEVEGIIKPSESVAGMLEVVEKKSFQDTGTFWTWEGKVKQSRSLHSEKLADERAAIPVVRIVRIVNAPLSRPEVPTHVQFNYQLAHSQSRY